MNRSNRNGFIPEAARQEKPMRQFAIRLSALAIGVTALVAVPAIAPVQAKAAGRHMHIKKHQRHWRHPYYGAAWSVGPARPVAGFYAPSEPICPAIGKSFDCKIWPPPYADDPDRKTSRH
jgi:hypothetical protein